LKSPGELFKQHGTMMTLPEILQGPRHYT
jgi:hypothetical protein